MKLLQLLKKGKLKILQKDYTIRFMDGHCEDDRMIGRSEIKYCRITLATKMPDDEIEECGLHEVLHSISDNLELDLKEKQIGSLSNGLYCFLKENNLI